MRTSDEKFLVGIANDWINRLGICHTGLMPGFDSFREQVEFTHGVKITRLLMEMSNAKLGIIVGLLLFFKEEYKGTQFLQTQPPQTQATFKNFDGLDGHRQLVALAMPVVIAAMYDIMATETCPVGHKKDEWSKPAMKNFIRKHRKKH